MAKARFYVPREAFHGNRVAIEGDQARHLVSVLRKKPGDKVVVFDGQGTECIATLLRISRDLVVATIEKKEVRERTNRPTLALYAAVPKGRKFDLIVEAATELGADSITPLVTMRTVVKLEDHSVQTKLDRWRRIVVAAAKQCRRSTLPQINNPVDFRDAVQELPEWAFPILTWSNGNPPAILEVLREMSSSHREIRVYIGPEGGFSPEEMEMARDAGMRLASLGERVLRSETAAVASLAVISCFLDSHIKGEAPTSDTAD